MAVNVPPMLPHSVNVLPMPSPRPAVFAVPPLFGVQPIMNIPPPIQYQAVAPPTVRHYTNESRFIGIVVDGYMFAKSTSFSKSAYDLLIRTIALELVKRANVNPKNIHVCTNALHVMIPDPEEVHAHGLCGGERLKRNLEYLAALEKEGWNVHRSKLKLVDGKWRASEEDVIFSNTVWKMSMPNYGITSRNGHVRVTLTDIFLVTADGDHYSTVSENAGNEIRWCVSPKNANVSAKLSQWGNRTQRMIAIETSRCDRYDDCRRYACDLPHSPSRAPLCVDGYNCLDPHCKFIHPVVTINNVSYTTNRIVQTSGRTAVVKCGAPAVRCLDYNMSVCVKGDQCERLHIKTTKRPRDCKHRTSVIESHAASADVVTSKNEHAPVSDRLCPFGSNCVFKLKCLFRHIPNELRV